MKPPKAKATLAEIRALDARILAAMPQDKPALVRKKFKLVLRYIAELSQSLFMWSHS